MKSTSPPTAVYGEPGGDARVGRALAHLAGEAARAEPLAHARLVDAQLLASRRARPASPPCGRASAIWRSRLAHARLARVLARSRAGARGR